MAHFYTLLPERIRASRGVTTWDHRHGIVLSGLRRSAPSKGTPPCTALRLSRYAGTLLFPCWSCEAWSHAARRVRLDVEATSPGLGVSPTSVSEYPKGYPRNIAGLRYRKIPITLSIIGCNNSKVVLQFYNSRPN